MAAPIARLLQLSANETNVVIPQFSNRTLRQSWGLIRSAFVGEPLLFGKPLLTDWIEIEYGSFGTSHSPEDHERDESCRDGGQRTVRNEHWGGDIARAHCVQCVRGAW